MKGRKMINPRNNKKNPHENTLMGVILSDVTLEEKIEAIRETNPFFYLLTPKPKKGKHHGI
jgi:hypothetical protein